MCVQAKLNSQQSTLCQKKVIFALMEEVLPTTQSNTKIFILAERPTHACYQIGGQIGRNLRGKNKSTTILGGNTSRPQSQGEIQVHHNLRGNKCQSQSQREIQVHYNLRGIYKSTTI